MLEKSRFGIRDYRVLAAIFPVLIDGILDDAEVDAVEWTRLLGSLALGIAALFRNSGQTRNELAAVPKFLENVMSAFFHLTRTRQWRAIKPHELVTHGAQSIRNSGETPDASRSDAAFRADHDRQTSNKPKTLSLELVKNSYVDAMRLADKMVCSAMATFLPSNKGLHRFARPIQLPSEGTAPWADFARVHVRGLSHSLAWVRSTSNPLLSLIASPNYYNTGRIFSVFEMPDPETEEKGWYRLVGLNGGEVAQTTHLVAHKLPPVNPDVLHHRALNLPHLVDMAEDANLVSFPLSEHVLNVWAVPCFSPSMHGQTEVYIMRFMSATIYRYPDSRDHSVVGEQLAAPVALLEEEGLEAAAGNDGDEDIEPEPRDGHRILDPDEISELLATRLGAAGPEYLVSFSDDYERDAWVLSEFLRSSVAIIFGQMNRRIYLSSLCCDVAGLRMCVQGKVRAECFASTTSVNDCESAQARALLVLSMCQESTCTGTYKQSTTSPEYFNS
jgi:hypothetical protein